MADFNISFKQTMGDEGPYSFDPGDHGGETCWGISRNFFPKWEGWATVDTMGRDKKLIAANLTLKEQAKTFYKREFWDAWFGDLMPQKLADQIFDSSINQGQVTIYKDLQRALNITNNWARGFDLQVDGLWGQGSQAALENALSRGKVDLLVKILNILQGARYCDIMEKDFSQRQFVGWFSRVKL